MSLQTDSPQSTTARWPYVRSVGAGVAFVALVALMNVALNRVVALSEPLVPPISQYEYVVSVPLSPSVAAGLLVGTVFGAVVTLMLFVATVAPKNQTATQQSPLTGGRLIRGAVTLSLGLALAVLGAGFLLIPGLVLLVYTPLIAISVVTDGHSIRGAISASHTRLMRRPLPYIATTGIVLLVVIGIGAVGVLTAALSPTAEFVVGGLGTGVVLLAGMRTLTRLYHAGVAVTGPSPNERL